MTARDRLSGEAIQEIGDILNRVSLTLKTLRQKFNLHTTSSQPALAEPPEELVQLAELIEALAGEEGESPELADFGKHFTRLKQCVDDLLEPIQTKIADNILFTDEAAREINYLFINSTGLIESSLSCLMSPNYLLKKYVAGEGKHLLSQLKGFVDNHHERVQAGRCRPESSHIYTAIVDSQGCLIKAIMDVNQLC